MDKIEYRRNYYQEHRAERLAYQRKYYTEHREEAFARSREWYQRHQEEARKRNRERYRKRRNEILAQQKGYCQANPEKRHAKKLAQKVPLDSHCEICGTTERLQRHHPNYDEPLKIVTLCRNCHRKLHKPITLVPCGGEDTKK